MLHRTRQLLVRQRTMLSNALRGHLAELGIVSAKGRNGISQLLGIITDVTDNRVAPAVRGLLDVLARQYSAIGAEIRSIDKSILTWHRACEASRRLEEIPGIGPIVATALVAEIGDWREFRSGRNLAAWIGLVPRQHSTGGKDKLGGITKQGNRYLRWLLVTGAMAVIRYAKKHGSGRRPWLAHPVGSGFVASLAHPGGNATGFTLFEYATSGKWPELLKQIAPSVTRAAVLWDPTVPSGIGQFAIIQSVAPSVGMEVSPVDMRDAAEIERAVAAVAREPNGGLIVTASALSVAHGDLIVTLAARRKLPAVYYRRLYVTGGGLISYGPDVADQLRRAAGYVDRILKGEKPADLPVQAPTKYELVINLKTAKALGLTVPPTLLARADEVIE